MFVDYILFITKYAIEKSSLGIGVTVFGTVFFFAGFKEKS